MAEETIPSDDVSLPAVSHIGFVVDDLEDGMRRFGDALGLGPWLLYRYEPPRLSDTTYRGEPAEYSMRVAVTDLGGPIDLATRVVSGETLARLIGGLALLRDRLGLTPNHTSNGEGSSLPSIPTPRPPGMNIELIEPLSGPSSYTASLEADERGVHHVGCFSYDDPHGAVERYEEAGISVLQSGRYEALEFWYLDMREELDGLILEIAANTWAVPEPDGVFSR